MADKANTITTPEYVVKSILAEYTQTEEDRKSYEALWTRGAKYYAPMSAKFTKRDASEKGGQPLRANTLNSTPEQACNTFSAGLSSLLANPSIKWFQLMSYKPKEGTSDQNKTQEAEERKYFDAVERTMFDIFEAPVTGFRTALDQFLREIAALGNAGMRVTYTEKEGFYFQCIPMRNLYWSIDYSGRVENTYRRFSMNLREAAIKFGVENLSAENKKLLTEADADLVKEGGKDKAAAKQVEIVHAIVRKNKFFPSKDLKDGESTPFIGLYIDIGDKHPMSEEFFKSQPIICARWSTVAGEVYGRGPGNVAIRDVELLQKQERTFLNGAEYEFDPSFDVPEGAYKETPVLKPKALNIRREGAEKMTPLEARSQSNLILNTEVIERTEARINNAFYTDLMALAQDLPQMTATEVLERTNDRLRIIAPMISRLEAEFKTPLIERVFSLAKDNKWLEHIENPIEKGALKVVNTGPVATALKTNSLVKTERMLNILLPMAQADESVLRVFNWAELASDVADALDIDQDLLRDKQEVEAEQQETQDLVAAEQESQINVNEANAADKNQGGRPPAADTLPTQ